MKAAHSRAASYGNQRENEFILQRWEMQLVKDIETKLMVQIIGQLGTYKSLKN